MSANGSGAFWTGAYRNVFAELGYRPEEIEARKNEIFQTLFYGSEEERIYHPVGDDMGYMEDTGNHDARTEGMSYGMMMCVQMDRKEEFDRIWKWAKTHMYMETGENAGYFAWSCQTDGTKNSLGPAPDGEEYFAMALFFASNRWGDGEGIFCYSDQARKLLHDCVHKGERPGTGEPMWDPSNHLIRFVPDCDFSDPSYHLPHYYELFALWADGQDRDFWRQAAQAGRDYLKKACHPVTGLSPEYAEYDGSPFVREYPGSRRDWYYSDAYRTVANVALDWAWFGKEPWEQKEAERLQRFYCEAIKPEDWDGVFLTDGTMLEEKAMHPTAIVAVNAQAALAALSPDAAGSFGEAEKNAVHCVRRFWETPLRRGSRRYYDNCLYFFAFLALSGSYRIYMPRKERK
ncbi:MAG: glycosyl hydrolase family 8 [Eubacteriales bacterium]|nr:glycosyl hydrolase family 8 [Eubacteriales bacterium]